MTRNEELAREIAHIIVGTVSGLGILILILFWIALMYFGAYVISEYLLNFFAFEPFVISLLLVILLWK